jgi:hypothetical protein
MRFAGEEGKPMMRHQAALESITFKPKTGGQIGWLSLILCIKVAGHAAHNTAT